jgi:hypothetical protein
MELGSVGCSFFHVFYRNPNGNQTVRNRGGGVMVKITVSLTFVMVTAIVFIFTVNTSRLDIPVGLVDLYGDTSGIRQLTIEGTVISWESSYAYTFRVSPNETTTEMHVFSNRNDLAPFLWPFSAPLNLWNPLFHTVYVPVLPYEIVQRDSHRMAVLVNPDGTHTYMPEYRIYGDIFAVEMYMFEHPIVIRNGEHRLYIEAGDGGYLYAFQENTPLSQFMLHQAGANLWGSQSRHNVWALTGSLTMGDLRIFVPTGEGLFGETAVFAVHTPGGHLFINDENPVTADVLIPVSLERGSEILGLIEIHDGFLLLIQRGMVLEITRYNIDTQQTVIAEIEGLVNFHRLFLHKNSVILDGSRFTHNGWENVTVALELSNDGGFTVTGPLSFPVGDKTETGPLTIPIGDNVTLIEVANIRDALIRDGIIYFAYTMEQNPFHFPLAHTATFVSAFDTQGRLTGRVQVLNGVEEDTFWINENGGKRQPFERRVQTLSFR